MTASLTSPYALVQEAKASQKAHQEPRYFAPVVQAPKVPAVQVKVAANVPASPSPETGAIPAAVAPLKAQ